MDGGLRRSGQQTARAAANLLSTSGDGFVVPTRRQRETILVAFVRKGFVVYGKAFDIVKCDQPVNLNSAEDVLKNLDHLVLYEIKSTNKPTVKPGFQGYFFSLSTAELLVAQNLGPRFRFIFVNTLTGETLELALREVFARSRAIYPTWSIAF